MVFLALPRTLEQLMRTKSPFLSRPRFSPPARSTPLVGTRRHRPLSCLIGLEILAIAVAQPVPQQVAHGLSCCGNVCLGGGRVRDCGADLASILSGCR